jgi:hypothetical protein
MSDYQPPELSNEEHALLRADYERWVKSNGVTKIRLLLDTLVVSNAILTKETNELRTRLGLPARPTYNLGSKK